MSVVTSTSDRRRGKITRAQPILGINLLADLHISIQTALKSESGSIVWLCVRAG